MDYHSLPRKQLQSLCKNHGIPANMTNVAMADALKSLNLPEGSVTGIQPTDAVILQDSGMNSPVSTSVSCRRTPLKTCTRSMARTTRSRREPEREEEEPKSSNRGVPDSLSEVKGSPEQLRTPRTVARSGRRITTRASARRQIEKVEIGGDLSAHVKLHLPPVVLPESEKSVSSSAQASRRRLTRSSARCQIEQKEIKPERTKNDNQNPPTSSSIYNTRRSARLRANNPESENNPSAIENLEKKLIDESENEPLDGASQLSSFSGSCDSLRTNVTQKSDQEPTGNISDESSIAIRDSDSTTGAFQEIFVHMPDEIPSSGGLFSSSKKYQVEQPSCKTETRTAGDSDAIFVQEICIGEEGNSGKVEEHNIVADNSLLSVKIYPENITIHENTNGCLFHTESLQKIFPTNEISCLDKKLDASLDPKTSPGEAGSEVIPANDNTAFVEANSNGEEEYDVAGSNEDTAPLDLDSNGNEAYNSQFPLPLEAREDTASFDPKTSPGEGGSEVIPAKDNTAASVETNSNGEEAYDAAGSNEDTAPLDLDSNGNEAYNPQFPILPANDNTAASVETNSNGEEAYDAAGSNEDIAPLDLDSNGNEAYNPQFPILLEARENTASVKANSNGEAYNAAGREDTASLKDADYNCKEAHSQLPLPLGVLGDECCFIAKAPLDPDSNGNEAYNSQFPLPLEAREDTVSVKANSNGEAYDAAGSEDTASLKDADSNGKEAHSLQLPFPLEVLGEIHSSHDASVAVKPEIANVAFALFSIEAFNEAKAVLQPFQPLENIEEQELLQHEAHDSRNECCFIAPEGSINYPGIADSESDIKPLPSAEESFNIPLITESIPLLGIVIEDGSLTSEIAVNNSEVGNLSEAVKVLPNEASGKVQQIEEPAMPSPPSLRAWCAIPSLDDYSQQVSPLANSSIMKSGKSIGNASGTKVAASSGRKVHMSIEALMDKENNASGMKPAASSAKKVRMSTEPSVEKENVNTNEKDLMNLSLRKLRTMVKEKEASKNVQMTARAPLGTLPGNRLLDDQNHETA